VDTTVGGDFLYLCDQKSTHRHGSWSERLLCSECV